MASIGFFIKEDDSIHRMTTDFHNNILTGRAKIKEFAANRIKYACLTLDSYNKIFKEDYEYIAFKEDGYVNAPATHKLALMHYHNSPLPLSEKTQLKITVEKLKKTNKWVPDEKIKKEIMMQAIGKRNSVFIND